MKMREAPWSAVAPATAIFPEFHGGSFAAALQGASGTRIFKAVIHARLLTGTQKP